MLFGTPLSPGLEALRRAMAHANSGHHEQAAKAANEAADLLADAFGGLVAVFARRKAFHDQWAKSEHYAKLQAAYETRQDALSAWRRRRMTRTSPT
jgi:hypothetical protein